MSPSFHYTKTGDEELEKNVWSGELSLPGEHFTQERVKALVTAMGLYLEDAVYTTEGEENITFNPQTAISDGDGLAGYFTENEVLEAMTALQADGVLRAVYVEGDYEASEFEGRGKDGARHWAQVMDSFQTEELPGLVRMDGILYQLAEVEAVVQIGDAI